MGKSILPMGGRGLGLAAKLSNNYLSGIIALATSEAMNLGMKLGIDPKILSDCLDKGSAANWVNSTVNPGKFVILYPLIVIKLLDHTLVPGVCPDAVTSKDYEGGFKVQFPTNARKRSYFLTGATDGERHETGSRGSA
jgi:3-hydroxyisobutyrate dehydrogenase